jgi:hypothetical protein
MTAPTIKLRPGADELLQAFPAGEPDFEAQALAIEARLKTEAPVSSGDLFAPPDLAAEPGEPAADSRVRAAAAPKSNFAEMARKSLHKPQDDAAQLAKELLAATAQSRRPTAEMVERVRAAGKAAGATSTPLPNSEAAQRPSGVVARAEPVAASAAVAPVAPSANNRGTVVALVGSALALAAAFVLFVRSQSAETENATSAALAREKAAQANASPATTAPPSTAAAPKSEGVLTPEELTAAPAAQARATPAPGAPAKVAGGALAAGAAKAAAAAAAAAAPASSAVVLEEDAQPAQAVAEPAPKAEPTSEPELKPAEGNSGSVPLTPSAGAVSTALSSVRSNAQACLAGQNDPVSAVVTFAPDGHVLRVSAGGPSGACIQAALSKARIQPFARESFSATTTIRPP